MQIRYAPWAALTTLESESRSSTSSSYSQQCFSAQCVLNFLSKYCRRKLFKIGIVVSEIKYMNL